MLTAVDKGRKGKGRTVNARFAVMCAHCLVAVARNRCSVPCELAGQMISTRLYPGSVVALAGDAVVARHARLTGSCRNSA
jgi:hypothetical protein